MSKLAACRPGGALRSPEPTVEQRPGGRARLAATSGVPVRGTAAVG